MRLRGSEIIVFRKILRPYLMDNPLRVSKYFPPWFCKLILLFVLFFQVEKFIKEDVDPTLQSYKNVLQGTAEVHV